MKIDVVSDLHLDVFDYYDTSNMEETFDRWFEDSDSNVLLVAGDVEQCLGSDKNELADLFFDYVTNRYDFVACVLGNHDYWNEAPYYDKERYNFNTMVSEARKRYQRVAFLNAEEVLYYDGFGIIGATMWTDVPPASRYTVMQMMNDYKMSLYPNGNRLNVDTTSAECNRVTNFLFDAVTNNKDTNFIILTHHVPYPCYSYGRLGSPSGHGCGYAYTNNLENFILDNPNIKMWAFGHTHVPVDTMCGDCHLVCNPHGYLFYEQNYKNYKVKTVKI